MIKSRRRRGAQLGMLAAVALGMGSFGVAGASATVPAWMEFPMGGNTPATVSGTLQLSTLGGVFTTSCPVLTTTRPHGTPPTPMAFSTGFQGVSRQTCSNGQQFEVDATFSLSGTPGNWSAVLQHLYGSQLSPFTVSVTSTWWQDSTVTIPLTNGAGGVPTKLTFNHTKLGYQYSSTNGVYATGTLNVNTPGGGTLTVGLR